MAKMQVRIEGYVYDHQGEPIPGTKITLPEVGKQVTSREDGRYLFDEVGLERANTQSNAARQRVTNLLRINQSKLR
jgi:hypothetical protein